MPSEKEPESMHWADAIALEVKNRVENDPILKAAVEKHGYYRIYDEKTPSGTIHIGSGRGWIIHDAIAKSMRKLGLNAKFVLSSDDMDPYDKPNKDLPKEWDKYLGMPFRYIPSPAKGYKSFGDYYFMQCVEKFPDYGINAEIESTGEEYEKGTFNPAIKIVLDNSEKIKEIYKRLYGEDAFGANRIPFNVLCEKCGKIATTNALSWDKKTEIVEYECTDDVVEWAKGCGHKGKRSPYNGGGKFPWKVEWPAKWPTFSVVCELAGKDHFTEGGSRTCGIVISDEIFNYPPPYPSTRKNTGKGYEFFNVGGKKMSTSKGIGVGFAEIIEHIPAKMLRFLLIKTRPNAVVDFDTNKPNDIILLYDKYDYCERVYFKKEKVDEKEYQKQKRIYELSHIGELPKKMPIQIPLTYAATVIQTGLSEEGAIKILKRTKHVPAKASKAALETLKQRLREAKHWVDEFATDDYKFIINEKAPEKLELTYPQQQALRKAAEAMDKIDDEKQLHNHFYEICKELNLDAKDFFKAAYQVLINKEKGPRLAGFMLTIGKDKINVLFSF